MEKATKIKRAYFCNKCNFFETTGSVKKYGYCLVFKCMRKDEQECMDEFVAEAVEFKLLMMAGFEIEELKDEKNQKPVLLGKLKRPKQIAKELRNFKNIIT